MINHQREMCSIEQNQKSFAFHEAQALVSLLTARCKRTQSILENNAQDRVIVVHIKHLPLTTYTHTKQSFVVFTIALPSRP